MQCVKCDGELAKVTIDGVDVDKCDKCSGIWFDFGELEQMLEQADIDELRNVVDNNEGDDSKKGVCPRCGGIGNMVQVANLEKKGVHVDTCLVCYGQWLDGGELEKLRERGLFGSVKELFSSLLR